MLGLQPLMFRALAAGFGVAGRVVPAGLRPRHDPAGLVRAARASPPPDALQGLVRLISAIDNESKLTLFGNISVRWDFIRLLRNAEHVNKMLAENPALGQAPVTAPLFILGLPRSGTSFLHALLALDPANQVPRMWQTIYPAPRPPGFNPAGNAHVRAVDAQLKLFAAMAPGFDEAHPVTADSPQECSEINAHCFQSLRFDTTFRGPSYLAWLDARGHRDAFVFHKQFLQILQAGIAAPRWVLKCPDHVFSIPDILAVYPDARFVIVHRDPMKVFGSVAHLTEILRRPFLENIDPCEIGEQVTARWITGASELVAFDQRADISPSRKINLHHDNLIAEPLAWIARIYEHFGMSFSQTAMSAITKAVAARPDGGYSGSRRYALSHFGIRPERLIPQFAPYVDYFHVGR
jgi:hypothetical protein